MTTLAQMVGASSFFKTEQPSITVVSGLPRSGTSMMMRMLAAAGMHHLSDNHRISDESNPNGYFEYSGVDRMAKGDHQWLENAVGKVVKVVSAKLQYLPENYNYKIIFMQRELHEVVTSQRLMLEREGKPADFDDSEMAGVFADHLVKVKAWLANQVNMDVIYLNYYEVLASAGHNLAHLPPFLGRSLDLDSMTTTIDPDLYRNRYNAVLSAAPQACDRRPS